MGVENNECVIATTWSSDYMNKVKEWISTLSDCEQSLFAVLPSIVNNKETVILAPDGSKKGWAEAESGKARRQAFIKVLQDFDYGDGSNPFDWVEVSYGEYGQSIVQGNCVDRYS